MNPVTQPPSQDASLMDRREFLRGVAAGATLTAAGLAGAPQSAAAAAPAPAAPHAPPFAAIQIGPHTILDEGIDHCLELLQDTAAVNCLMVYSHSYHSDFRKPPQLVATDHGLATRPSPSRKLPSVWIRQHDQFFKNTALRHQKLDSSFTYADRDLFAELAAPARKRGMKLYARILEAKGPTVAREIDNFSRIQTVDIFGRTATVGCWNHPDYINFWTATAEDMFSNYDLDGLQFGAERCGPLMNVLLARADVAPACFCEHCQARGRARGIDPDRARQGYENLYNYARSLKTDRPAPADGVFACFLRILLRHPEILSWEYQFRLAREEVLQAIYKSVKTIKPGAVVGWHVDHQATSFDLVARAELSYEEAAAYSDFIKLVAYHDILGPRVRFWYLDLLQKGVLAEVPLEDSLSLYYDLLGYDKNTEPKLAALEKTGFSPDYVYRLTKQSVASAAGKTKILTGVGFDIPWNSTLMPADPEKIYQSVLKSFEAGAAGVVASREYEEMRMPSLRAFGRAIRELAAK